MPFVASPGDPAVCQAMCEHLTEVFFDGTATRQRAREDAEEAAQGVRTRGR